MIIYFLFLILMTIVGLGYLAIAKMTWEDPGAAGFEKLLLSFCALVMFGGVIWGVISLFN